MLTSLLLFVLAVEVLLPLLVYLGRNRMIFLPSVAPGPEEGMGSFGPGVEAELVRIPRPDGTSGGRRLAAYDVRPRGFDDDSGPVVIFAHGNAGNLYWRSGLLAAFVRGTGARTVMFDYSGYGGNPGRPGEEEVYRDGLAVYDHLAGEGVAPERIVLYGESLGGAVALAVASRRRVAGVVLQSCFSSAPSVALRIYPWLPLVALLVRGDFPNARRLARLDAPALVVHGTRDEIIPFAEGRRLHAAAPERADFLPIEGAGHNDLFEVGGARYLEELGERFRGWVAEAAEGKAGEPAAP